jgi:hypothetical protein
MIRLPTNLHLILINATIRAIMEVVGKNILEVIEEKRLR